MSKSFSQGSWSGKFKDAFRGILVGSRGGRTNSFYIHVPAAIGVIAISIWKGLSVVESTLLLLCIALVLVAELFNSGLESLAKAVTDEENQHVRDALDISSGAVLVASVFAMTIGALVLFYSA